MREERASLFDALPPDGLELLTELIYAADEVVKLPWPHPMSYSQEYHEALLRLAHASSEAGIALGICHICGQFRDAPGLLFCSFPHPVAARAE